MYFDIDYLSHWLLLFLYAHIPFLICHLSFAICVIFICLAVTPVGIQTWIQNTVMTMTIAPGFNHFDDWTTEWLITIWMRIKNFGESVLFIHVVFAAAAVDVEWVYTLQSSAHRQSYITTLDIVQVFFAFFKMTIHFNFSFFEMNMRACCCAQPKASDLNWFL